MRSLKRKEGRMALGEGVGVEGGSLSACFQDEIKVVKAMRAPRMMAVI